MKTSIILILVAVLTTTSLPYPLAAQNPCEQMAQQVIVAFRTNSPEAYVALFPSLAEFHDLMDANANVYGETLEAAKEEFSARYMRFLAWRLSAMIYRWNVLASSAVRVTE